MFDKHLEVYILKMESIKLIKETIEKYIPNIINNYKIFDILSNNDI